MTPTKSIAMRLIDGFGCLIVVPGQSTMQTKDLVEHFDGLCVDADVAFRIGGGLGAIWLAFAFVD